METIIAVHATMLTVLLMLPVGGIAQTPPKASTFTVAGHAGEAQLLQKLPSPKTKHQTGQQDDQRDPRKKEF